MFINSLNAMESPSASAGVSSVCEPFLQDYHGTQVGSHGWLPHCTCIALMVGRRMPCASHRTILYRTVLSEALNSQAIWRCSCHGSKAKLCELSGILGLRQCIAWSQTLEYNAGMARTRDFEEAGIGRWRLPDLITTGLVEKVVHGLYRSRTVPYSANMELARGAPDVSLVPYLEFLKEDLIYSIPCAKRNSLVWDPVGVGLINQINGDVWLGLE